MIFVFPVLQVALFGTACVLSTTQPLAAVALAVLAAVLLCFSVHVSIHEAVHQPALTRFRLAGPILSLVMGLPFQGYRWHHRNHHQHNNGLDDYSSTWRRTAAGPRPWPLWRYALGWPRQLVRSGLAMRAAAASGGVPTATQRAIRIEQVALLATLLGLGVGAPRAALLYLVQVYAGWALIALQNFGQHPPLRCGLEAPTSYYAGLYNRLLFRNGLHAEHHAQPHLAWHEIEPQPHPAIAAPHLLQPFWRRGHA